MADPRRFRFSVADEQNAARLRTIPASYRSLFLEMALQTWFASEKATPSRAFYSILKAETGRPVRFRISLTAESIIRRLQAISPRHRSLVAESALAAFLESDSGLRLFETLSSRNPARSRGQPDPVGPESGPGRSRENPIQKRTVNESDTEALIKKVLEFS
ncbi:MAG: hypothetical protein ACOZF0_21110 [Thermodesulfobacteriota bacterium]